MKTKQINIFLKDTDCVNAHGVTIIIECDAPPDDANATRYVQNLVHAIHEHLRKGHDGSQGLTPIHTSTMERPDRLGNLDLCLN